MPAFQIEAKYDINRGSLHIDKGQMFTININLNGIGPNNLFNNPRCFNQLKQQFQNQGIFLSDADMRVPFNWNIKKL